MIRDFTDPRLRDTVARLVRRGAVRVLRRDDGTLFATSGPGNPGQSDEQLEIHASDARVLAQHRLLGIDLRSVPT